MATPHGRRRVPHTRASLELRTSEFSTLRINRYAPRGVNVVFCFGEMAPIAAKMVLDKGKLNKIVSEREVGTLQERQRDPKSSIFHP